MGVILHDSDDESGEDAVVYFLPKCLKYQQDHPGTWLMTPISKFCTQEGVEDAPEMNLATFNTVSEHQITPLLILQIKTMI
eukprot:2713132-Ditylum_brightwellii.AAC.1